MSKVDRTAYCLVQVFSISVRLKKKQHVSFTLDADGSIKPCNSIGDPTFLSDEELGGSGSSYSERDDRCMKLYGTVTARDTGGPRTLFQREKTMSVFIRNYDTISISDLNATDCLTSFYLDIQLDLKDAEQVLEVSRGFLFYDVGKKFYSKRLCNVIPGKDGSATVHFSIFPKAVQASVAVNLSISGDPGSSAFVVYGSIYARYKGHDYSNEYQRRYYKIMLFKMPQHEALPLTSDTVTLPMSFSFVAVPIKTSLIIEADLHVMADGCDIAAISDVGEFSEETSNGSSTKTMVGEHGALNVAVNWLKWGKR